MSDKPPQDPLEQLPKQIRDMLRGSPFAANFETRAASTENPPSSSTDTEREETLKRIRKFNLKPREIRDLPTIHPAG